MIIESVTILTLYTLIRFVNKFIIKYAYVSISFYLDKIIDKSCIDCLVFLFFEYVEDLFLEHKSQLYFTIHQLYSINSNIQA